MLGRPTNKSAALALVVALCAMPACSLGDKAAMTDRIIGSVDELESAGPATGLLHLSFRLVDVPDAAGPIVNAPTGGPTSVVSGFHPLGVTVDAAHATASITGDGSAAALFDHLRLYGHRTEADALDARPWMKVDLEHVAVDSGKVDLRRINPVAFAYGFSPLVFTDLIAGALTGSVRRLGTGTAAGGVAVTKYKANFDLDKVLHDTRRSRYSDDERDALDDTFTALSLEGRVHKGVVWLDEDGRPRHLAVALRVSPQQGFVFEVRLVLDLVHFGAEPVAAVPSDDELLETDTLVDYLLAVTPQATAP